MTSQETFEKWWYAQGYSGICRHDMDMSFKAYQARQPEIDALKAEGFALRATCEQFKDHFVRSSRENALLKAEIQSANAELSLCTGLWHETGRMVETLKAEVTHWQTMAQDSMSSTYWKLAGLEADAKHFEEETNKLKAENEGLRKAAQEVLDLTCKIREQGHGILALEAAIGYLADAMTAPDTKGE